MKQSMIDFWINEEIRKSEKMIRTLQIAIGEEQSKIEVLEAIKEGEKTR